MTEPTFTHKATLTVTSNEDNGEVHVKVTWTPDIDGAAIEALGYMPAAYNFIQTYVVPMLDEAYGRIGIPADAEDWEYPEWEITPPDSIN